MLVISVLNVTVATQPVFLLAAGAPQAGSELGFSTFGLGLLAAVFFLTAAAASTSAGRIVERIGWLRAMRLTTTGAIATLLAIAVWGRSILAMLSMLAVGAVFYSFANPASNLALARLAGPVRPATFSASNMQAFRRRRCSPGWQSRSSTCAGGGGGPIWRRPSSDCCSWR